MNHIIVNDVPAVSMFIICVNMEDNYKHKGMRGYLIDEISTKNIASKQVLEAMRRVPRHYFLDTAFLEQAYEDKAFPIAEGQTISQPSTVAFQTELLKIRKGDRVLEVGTGSGYQTSVLIELGGLPISLELSHILYKKARIRLKKIGYKKANCVHGDGSKGYELLAPYDKILVTAAAPYVPMPLIRQLKVGGILVIPVGTMDRQQMFRIIKTSRNNDTTVETYHDFRFVPLQGEYGWYQDLSEHP